MARAFINMIRPLGESLERVLRCKTTARIEIRLKVTSLLRVGTCPVTDHRLAEESEGREFESRGGPCGRRSIQGWNCNPIKQLPTLSGSEEYT
jgi:hypothetical protein